MRTFGENLKETRKRMGVSQQQLADRLEISLPGISQWESNRRSPKPDTVRRIAKALEASVTELIDFSPPERGIIISIEEKLSELEQRIDIAEQEDASEAPGAVSHEGMLRELGQSFNILEDALNFILSYALTDEEYTPQSIDRREPVRRIEPVKKIQTENYPEDVTSVMREVSELLRAANIPPEQAWLLRGIFPLIYDITACAIREDGRKKTDCGNELLELYGKLNLQGQRVAVGRLKELLQIQAYAKSPSKDGGGE